MSPNDTTQTRHSASSIFQSIYTNFCMITDSRNRSDDSDKHGARHIFCFFFPISVYIFTTYLTGIAYLGGTQIVINDHILKS
jgi:hypothetical protein